MNIKNLLVSSAFILASTTACSAGSIEVKPTKNEQTGTLTVHVTNIRDAKGQLMVAIHDTKRAYDNNNERAAYAAITMKLKSKAASFSFHDLPQGNYAVVLFHDENANGVFDIRGDEPLEGYGMSGARHALDQPSFRKASVPVGNETRTVSVKMHYYK
ncbi:DUF2141 domain-containing protein [Kordiimonas laminariae]|uniref:DUF2141 domain-containing protein n=1 Tax=Kordiimonas laminariae TaxID=2917717 RepID=UPI001FF6D012|nr:DUF2141 domain-containing protein [Kordiimonas laminariae]MCK0069231.1 DUF2141 domain-containing protein [Kordiimonas laminariae]